MKVLSNKEEVARFVYCSALGSGGAYSKGFKHVIVKSLEFDGTEKHQLRTLLESIKNITFINCIIDIGKYIDGNFLVVSTIAERIKFIGCDLKRTNITFDNKGANYYSNIKEMSFINVKSEGRITFDASVTSLNILASYMSRVFINNNRVDLTTFFASIFNSTLNVLSVFNTSSSRCNSGTFDFLDSRIETFELLSCSNFRRISPVSNTFKSLFGGSVNNLLLTGSFFNCDFNGIVFNNVNFLAGKVKFEYCNFYGSDLSKAIITGNLISLKKIHVVRCDGLDNAKLGGRINISSDGTLLCDNGTPVNKSMKW